jgi:type IV secretory pathway TrbF-like protein
MAQTLFIPEGTNGTAFTRDGRNLDILDTINGRAQKTARTWQIIALVSLSSLFIALGILIYAETLPRTVPVIVAVTPEGKASYAGKVDKEAYGVSSVPEIAKEYLIRELIAKMHAWVIDPDAQQRYIAETQAVVQKGAAGQLDQFYRGNNPFARIGEVIQSVEIEPLHKQADKTYLAYFTVIQKTASGRELAQTKYSALINIDDGFVPTERNPLGVFITNFDIKRLGR